MKYRLPLPKRVRMAGNKRDQYRRDPAYRLKCINRSRERKGLPLVADLAEVEARL